MNPFCSLNFPQLITVSFHDKSRFQKCKQTAHKTLNSFPSLTYVSNPPLICCSESDTCRLKSDCCKNCSSFSQKFLPLLARTTTSYNLGYYEKKLNSLWFDLIYLYCHLQQREQLSHLCQSDWNSGGREKVEAFGVTTFKIRSLYCAHVYVSYWFFLKFFYIILKLF